MIFWGLAEEVFIVVVKLAGGALSYAASVDGRTHDCGGAKRQS
jgi:hypothetical protein